MPTFEFTVFLDHAPSESEYDRLFEAGLDDALPGTQDGRGFLDVTREASTLTEAIVSVASDAETAGFAVVGIEENDLVSLRTIATRFDRTYESVRLLAFGKRGPGNFPAPLSGDGWALYSWANVATWFATAYGTVAVASEHDRIIAAAGHILRARTLVASEPLAALVGLAHRPALLGDTFDSPADANDRTENSSSAVAK
jgi:hypothetical protein